MNKKLKGALSFIMALIMVFSLLAVTPYAAGEVLRLSTTTTSFKQGDKVVVYVTFDKAFDSAAVLDLSVKYDSTKLEINSVTKGNAIINARDLQSDDVYSETHSTKGEVRWVFAGTKNYHFSGTFAVIEFTVSGRAMSGTTSVTAVVNEAKNSSYVNVKPQLTVANVEFSVIRSAESDMRFKLNADGKSYSITAYGSGDRTVLEIPTTHYDLPITGISNGAFENHDELKEVKFTSTGTVPCLIETIGDSAFEGCSKLEKIDVPNTVTSIGADAFSGCSALKNITLSYSLKKIGREAFKDCTSLASIKLPFNLTDIGESAFAGCSKLATVYISKFTKNIDVTAFSNCAPLTFYTVAGNTTIDSYNTTAGLNATVKKTMKDLSLGTANVAPTAVLTKDGATPAVTIKLTNNAVPELNKDYTIIYLSNYKEGTAKIIVAGVGEYSEGYNLTFTVVCNHNWNKNVEKDPTCTETGLRHLKCDICGKEDTEVIDANGHVSNEWIIDKLPTITTTGLKHKVCMVDKVKFDENTIIDKVVPDANGDGNIDSGDALIVLQYTVGMENVMTEERLQQADCNGDGKVNSVDALTILRIVVGEIVL